MFSPMSRFNIWLGAADEIVELHHAWLQHLLPAERQQLARERRCALASRADRLDVVRCDPVGTRVREQQVAGTDDDGEQIVEVVSNAAGQLADRFHLLRLLELTLDAPLIGYIFPGGFHILLARE